MKIKPFYKSLILIGILFLINYFSPIIEFKSNSLEYIVRIILLGFYIYLFIQIFQPIPSFSLKLAAHLVTLIFSFLYLLESNVLLKEQNSRYEDVALISSTKNRKIVQQIRETSGSIHDYRTRIIYFENKIFSLGYTNY